MKPGQCYDRSKLWKPEFAYQTRVVKDPTTGKVIKRWRAESFILPFSFTVPATGSAQENYGWKLDDDVPWVFRGVIFPLSGTVEGPPSGFLIRIRDCYGNFLTNCLSTNDYVLAGGAWGQSGVNLINAFGFPLGCEVENERGGLITFDFQIPVATNPVVVQGTILGAKLFEEC